MIGTAFISLLASFVIALSGGPLDNDAPPSLDNNGPAAKRRYVPTGSTGQTPKAAKDQNDFLGTRQIARR